MKIAIIGAPGSGKSTLKRLLEAEGLKALTYMTDSEHPAEDERSVTGDDFECEAILRDIDPVDSRKRFTTKEELDEADVLIVTHPQLQELARLYPDQSIRAIWCEPTEESVAKHALSLELPEERIEDLLEHISTMRDARHNEKDVPENRNVSYIYTNDYEEGSAMDYAKWVMTQLRIREHLQTIIWQCKAFGNLYSRAKDTTVMYFPGEDGKARDKDMPDELFIDCLMEDNDGLAMLTKSWLSNPISIGVPDSLSADDGDDIPDTEESDEEADDGD